MELTFSVLPAIYTFYTELAWFGVELSLSSL